MKKTTFLLYALLALTACKKDNSEAQNDNEVNLEEAASEMGSNGDASTQSPDGSTTPPAPSTVELPEEPLPGATSTASAAPSAENPLFSFTIEPGQAGSVEIGMPIEKLRKQYGENKIRETTITQEGTESKAFEVLGERFRTDLLVEQQCTGKACKVSRITVINPAFKTTAGVGIGSTLGDLRKSIFIDHVATGEGKFVAVSKNSKMSFVLDMTSIPAERWPSLKLKDVPSTTTVTSIFLY